MPGRIGIGTGTGMFRPAGGMGVGGGAPTVDEFIFTVETTASPETFTIPCQDNGVFNATINWGDGEADSTITTYNDADLAHSYATAGTHTITISGTFPNIYFNNAGDRLKMRTVENLGSVGWTTFNNAFRGCSNMTGFTAGDNDISGVTSITGMLYSAGVSITLDLSTFDLPPGCTTVVSFLRATDYQGPLDLSHWNTSNITSFNSFIQGSKFTSVDISTWSTAGATFQDFFRTNSKLVSVSLPAAKALVVSGTASNAIRQTGLTTVDVSCFDMAGCDNLANFFSTSDLWTSIDGVDEWDITGLNGVSDLNSFMSGVISAMTTAQYDAVLIAWEAQNPISGLAPNFANSTYTGGGAAATARAALIAKSWVITDGGIAP